MPIHVVRGWSAARARARSLEEWPGSLVECGLGAPWAMVGRARKTRHLDGAGVLPATHLDEPRGPLEDSAVRSSVESRS